MEYKKIRELKKWIFQGNENQKIRLTSKLMSCWSIWNNVHLPLKKNEKKLKIWEIISNILPCYITTRCVLWWYILFYLSNKLWTFVDFNNVMQLVQSLFYCWQGWNYSVVVDTLVFLIGILAGVDGMHRFQMKT